MLRQYENSIDDKRQFTALVKDIFPEEAKNINLILMAYNMGIAQDIQKKFLGTETHSLSKLDAWRKAVASVRRKNAADDVPYLYMLSTDGFSNSFVNEEEFHKTCREYYKMIGEHGYEAVRDNLEKWLKETSELGCGDDVTVVMAYIDK